MRLALRVCASALWLLGVFTLASPARADFELLAFGRAFDEPVADPRWPRFAASYQEYANDPFLDSAAAVAFGGTFALVRDNPGGLLEKPAWELGVQASVFGTFEPLAPSQDLFNSDWQFGLYAAGRRGRLSGIARLWHQSSHLGDEFLLRNPGVRRINFVSQSLGGLAAYDLTDWSRAYAGGGWIFDETPSNYGNWQIQYGIEVRWPTTLFNGYARPFTAVDVQHLQGTDWQADVSLVAGVELREPSRDGPTLRVVVEYYLGRNLNGQFWEENVSYIGAGVQLGL